MPSRRSKSRGRRPQRAQGFLEHRDQCQFVARFRLQFPGLERLLFAVPNGGKRSKAEAARLKAEGVQPGIPDMMLAVPMRGVPGLFIEMKRSDGGGRVSKDQREVIELLREQGYQVNVCHGADEAWTVVTLYLAGYGEKEDPEAMDLLG